MNNTKRRTLAIVVLIFTAATLVVGATTIPSASAYLQKKGAQHYDNAKHNWKGNSNTDADTIQKCKQFASGFDPTFGDQNCDILSNSAINPTPTPEPIKKTCEQCFTTILTQAELTRFVDSLAAGATLADLCAQLESGVVRELDLRVGLGFVEIPVATQDQLIACLKDLGIAFRTT